MTTLDLHSTPERTIVDLRGFDLPGAHVLGRYRYTRPHEPLPSHSHDGMVEICYLHRGQQRYEVEGTRHTLRGGEFFITFPGERHSTGPDPEDRGVLYWLIVSADPPPEHFLGQSGSVGHDLPRRILDLRQRHFPAPGMVHQQLEQWLSLARRPGDPVNLALMRRVALAFILTVIRASDRKHYREAPPWLTRVLAEIERSLRTPRQVSELASVSGLSISRFKCRFREATGVAPAEYMLRRRVEAAERELRHTKKSVTDIAMDYGFSSSQNFATAFRRMTGTTPSSLRRQ